MKTYPWWRPDARTWTSGRWSVEIRGDELAEIRYGGRMLVRSVHAAVRDHGWSTVPVEVLSIDDADGALVLALRHRGLGADVSSRLTVRADAGSLTIAWDAESGTVFDTCRTGLIVLHPADAAGTPVTVTHSDGSVEPTRFPVAISPHQPVQDIRELRTAGVTLRFDGDVFEMEDQRNWTDASFKTYSRPLELPYPYRLDAGEHVRQSITIETADVIELVEAGAFPPVGVEASTAPDPVPASAAGAFRVVELDLRTPTWPAALDRAAADGLPLDVRLVTDGGSLDAAVAALAGHRVVRITAFDARAHVTLDDTLAALRAALEETSVEASVLAGARSHFTELNREQHRIPRDVDGLAVNTTPLFHAFGTEQLVESLAMQRLVARQTVAIAGGLPVHIGPVSLRPRFNNVATVPESAPARADLSEGYGAEFTGAADPRQRSAELAAWVVASAAALVIPGVDSVAWFETWGPRGLADHDGPAPAADAVTAVAELAGAALLTGDSPDGLIWAIGARRSDGDAILVANLDRETRRVGIARAGADPVTVELEPGTWQRLD